MSTDDTKTDRPDDGAPGGCLGPDVLAGLLDGVLEARERRDAQAHLAACGDCYALFSDSADFLRETGHPGETTPRRPWFVGRPAVAAVLVVAAMLTVVLLRPSRVVAPTVVEERAKQAALPRPAADAPLPASPASESRLIDRLIEGADIAPLAGAAWREDPAGLGFANSAVRERNLVLAGVHLLDLEVAIRGRRLVSARERLAALEPLADGMSARAAVRAFGAGLTEQRLAALDTDALRAQFEQGARPGPIEAARLIRFGQWVEAGRLAAGARHSRYFTQPEVRRGLDEARDLPFPEPLRRPLVAIESQLQPHPVSEAGWRRLERTLGQVLLLL